MKHFNLQEYLKNPDKKIVTKNGLDAKIICTDGSNPKYPIFALIQNKGGKNVLSYTNNGKNTDEYESPFDLFFATEKKSGWINLYKFENNVIFDSNRPYNSEELAKDNIMLAFDYITTIKIKWEE